MSLDILVIIPIEPPIAHIIDPVVRQTSGARMHGPLTEAFHDFEDYIGMSLSLYRLEHRPRFGGELWPPVMGAKAGDIGASRATQPPRRTLASVTLATHLEKAGLSWRVIDPGMQELHYWRKLLTKIQAQPPRTLAVCTTFIVCEPWLKSLCALIREILPNTKLVIGGYYYAVNVNKFPALGPGILSVGEGGGRLPLIVQAIAGRGRLEDIPGLYIRMPDGSTHFTGTVEQLNLNELPLVDWSLSTRIEPPIDVTQVPVSTWVETQRGCVFSCEFCDYRTIQTPAAMTPGRAAEAILNAAISPEGSVRITDSTATFPHARWRDIMQELIARGGSKVPLWCFARVTDLAEETASLMARAGVRHMFVGQESGDQRILNAMKKGTAIKHVRPAVQALGKYDLNATFAFIHGFPGEDDESILATRNMISSINDGFEQRPVVLLYLAQPLVLFQLSTVSQREEMQTVDHWMGYDSAKFPPQRALEEILKTVIEVSRVPHAPAYLLMPGTFPSYWEEFFFFSPHRYEIHRWLKSVERGVAIFLERNLSGTPPNNAELARVKSEVLARREEQPRWRSALDRIAARVQKSALQRLVREWLDEEKHGPGTLTRGLIGLSVLRDSGSLRRAQQAYKSGKFGDVGVSTCNVEQISQLATDLRQDSLGAVHRQRQVSAARKLREFVPTSSLTRRAGPTAGPDDGETGSAG